MDQEPKPLNRGKGDSPIFADHADHLSMAPVAAAKIGTVPCPLPKQQRLLLAGLGLGLIGLLVLARVLMPSPTDCGTHQQLGLPPCTFRVLFGLPCPTCGMTTAWAHLVRGELLAAVHANCGGLLLGVLAVLAVPWSLVSAVRGRWTGWTPGDKAAAWASSGLLIVILLQWAWRLWMMGKW